MACVRSALEAVPEFREIHIGHIDQVPPDRIETEFTYGFEAAATPDASFARGEPFGEFFERVVAGFENLLRQPEWSRLLLVGHGGTNRAILSWMVRGGLEALASFEQDEGCLNVLDVDLANGEVVRRYVRVMNLTSYNLTKEGRLHDDAGADHRGPGTGVAACRSSRPVRYPITNVCGMVQSGGQAFSVRRCARRPGRISQGEACMAAKQRKVIITCAATGSIHTPTMSPHLPLTPSEIAEQSIEASEAGAAIIHLHARNPEDGSPTPSPDVFMEFLPRIKQSCKAVVNITTGGGHGMTLEERLAGAMRTKPEMSSLNMGSMNFGLYPMLDRYSEFKYEWERKHLENSRDFIFRNTFKDIEYILRDLGEAHGTRFEFECYDVGHLYTLAHFLDRGLVKPPLFVQTIFGILGGIGADQENLMHMKRIADKLFGDDYYWSVLAAGRHQLGFVTMSAIMGGNIRVGLEDSLYAGKGRLATSNAEQVRIVRSILENLSLDIASPDEAREMLALKGGDAVGF